MVGAVLGFMANATRYASDKGVWSYKWVGGDEDLYDIFFSLREENSDLKAAKCSSGVLLPYWAIVQLATIHLHK